jgi:hypothetical protein
MDYGVLIARNNNKENGLKLWILGLGFDVQEELEDLSLMLLNHAR